MATPKNKAPAPKKVKDLSPRKDPKAGALDAYLYVKGQKQGSIKP